MTKTLFYDGVSGPDGLTLAGSALDVPDALFRALALISGQEITFTCVPPGSGARLIRSPPAAGVRATRST